MTVRKSEAAFSSVEIIVVLAIVAIMIAIALPLYQSSQSHARQRSCEANMASLHQAEQAYKTRTRLFVATDNAVTGDELAIFGEQLGGMPTCPSGTAPYVAIVTGSGATAQLTIRCDNTGAHIAGQKLQTSDGVTFVGITPP